jgi:hypothetical protein
MAKSRCGRLSGSNHPFVSLKLLLISYKNPLYFVVIMSIIILIIVFRNSGRNNDEQSF